jgi:hypothetical protein
VGRRGVVMIRVGRQTAGGNITVVEIDMPGVVVLRGPGSPSADSLRQMVSELNGTIVPKDKDGFTPIFNGKDLTGWEGEAGYWSVEDGAITGKTNEKLLDHPSYLFWKGGEPTDFELRAQYRFVTPDGNSGINFRSRRLPNWDVKGYQADMETGPNYTGILYECNQREIMTQRGQKVVIDENGHREESKLVDSAELQKHTKPNDWNEYTIVARGPEIILKVNGAVMSHVIDRQQGKAAAKGCITLQIHPGPPMKVQFKNIRIKNL